VKLPYRSHFRNDFCEIYEYRHFNQIDNGKEGVFENPSQERELISELATVYSIYDKYPVTEGHALVIPKRKSRTYPAFLTKACPDLSGKLVRMQGEGGYRK